MLALKSDVETMIQFTATRQTKPLRLPMWLKIGENGRYRRARRRVHAYIQDVIGQRRATPIERWPNDLLSKLMLARDEETGEAISDALLRDETITLSSPATKQPRAR